MAEEGRRKYYWLVTEDPDTGRPFLIFGGDSEEVARQKGLEMLGGIDFEIRAFPTRNLSRASSLLRGKRLDDTHSLHDATVRQGHDKSLRRLKHKLRKRN